MITPTASWSIDVGETTNAICILTLTDGKGQRCYWRDANNMSAKDLRFDANDPSLNGWKLYASAGPKPRATFAGWLGRFLRLSPKP
jgi:hypothetical protein